MVSYAPYAQTSIFRGLSVTEGLSDLVVNALYKDSIGYVWIGTGTSLERFDGVHLKRYLVSGNNEKLKRVNAIAETENNQRQSGGRRIAESGEQKEGSKNDVFNGKLVFGGCADGGCRDGRCVYRAFSENANIRAERKGKGMAAVGGHTGRSGVGERHREAEATADLRFIYPAVPCIGYGGIL